MEILGIVGSLASILALIGDVWPSILWWFHMQLRRPFHRAAETSSARNSVSKSSESVFELEIGSFIKVKSHRKNMLDERSEIEKQKGTKDPYFENDQKMDQIDEMQMPIGIEKLETQEVFSTPKGVKKNA